MWRACGSVAVTFILCFSTSGVAKGEILLSYDFSGQSGSQETTPGSLAPGAVGLTPLDMKRSGGLNPHGHDNSFASTGWDLPAWNASDENFVSFGFAVEPGFQVNLTEVSITSTSNGPGVGRGALRTSLDDFASNLFEFNVQETATFDASVLGPITEDIAFRLVNNDALARNQGPIQNNGQWRITGLDVRGTAVPEPGSMLLLALAAVVGWAIRCRTRRNRVATQQVFAA